MVDFKATSAHDDFVGGWVEGQTGEFCLWDLMTAMDIPQERRNKRLQTELLQAMKDAGAKPTGKRERVAREGMGKKCSIKATLFTFEPPSDAGF
jgi:hypothetical protein